WSFGSWKLEPRDMNDISISSNVGEQVFEGTSLYPIPSNGWVRYELPVAGLEYSLSDLSGRLLDSGSLDLSGMLDLSRYMDGAYVLQLTDGNRVRSERVVIAR
ncbi:MAG: T9SS type A sorting domain-containing protein, partial [Flavobacteriales bacterium]|nr:T9SS type A sorting domain-containing protein [Flavobacteriales bacterium]